MDSENSRHQKGGELLNVAGEEEAKDKFGGLGDNIEFNRE